MNLLKGILCQALEFLHLHNVEAFGIKEFYKDTTNKKAFESFAKKIKSEKAESNLSKCVIQ